MTGVGESWSPKQVVPPVASSNSRPTAAAQLRRPKSQGFLRIFPPSGPTNSHAQKLPHEPECPISNVTSVLRGSVHSPFFPGDILILSHREPCLLPAIMSHLSSSNDCPSEEGLLPSLSSKSVSKRAWTSSSNILSSLAVSMVLLS